MIYTKVYQREGDVNIETNNAEHPKLNAINVQGSLKVKLVLAKFN